MTLTTEQIKEIQDNGLEAFGRYYSCYRGFVKDNQDPEFLGRLKVSCPQIHDENAVSDWAYGKGMFMGTGAGMYMIPKIGEMVWVSFEFGDVRKPVWEHCHFGTGDMPDAMKNNGKKPTNMVWQSYTGHRIELDDFNKLVRIFNKAGQVVELNEHGISLVTDKIALGTLNGAAEPAVLGDTAMELLIEFMDDMGKLATIQTSSGVTGLVNTAVNWPAFEEKWNEKWKKFKSAKVSLD